MNIQGQRPTTSPWHPIEEEILRTATSLQNAYTTLKREGYNRTMSAIKNRNKKLKEKNNG